MTEQEKAISQLCIAAQDCCEELRNAYCIEESYDMDCIEECIEKIHRIVNPDFNKICEDVEEVMERFCSGACNGDFNE